MVTIKCGQNEVLTSGQNEQWSKWKVVKIESGKKKWWQMVKIDSGQNWTWSKWKMVEIESGKNWEIKIKCGQNKKCCQVVKLKWSKLKVVKIKCWQVEKLSGKNKK